VRHALDDLLSQRLFGLAWLSTRGRAARWRLDLLREAFSKARFLVLDGGFATPAMLNRLERGSASTSEKREAGMGFTSLVAGLFLPRLGWARSPPRPSCQTRHVLTCLIAATASAASTAP
jgi:hypothetical protein